MICKGVVLVLFLAAGVFITPPTAVTVTAQQQQPINKAPAPSPGGASNKAPLGVAYLSSYSTPGFPEANTRIKEYHSIGFRQV